MIIHLFVVDINKYTLMRNADIEAGEELTQGSLNLITMKLNDLAASFGLTILVYAPNSIGAWEQQKTIGIPKGQKIYKINWL